MISVELKITPRDVVRKEVSITATYADSEDPDNPIVVNITTALLVDLDQKLKVLDNIHAHYLIALAKRGASESFISDLEITGAANLEARL